MISFIEYVEASCEESDYHEAISSQGKDEKEGKTNKTKFLVALTPLSDAFQYPCKFGALLFPLVLTLMSGWHILTETATLTLDLLGLPP